MPETMIHEPHAQPTEKPVRILIGSDTCPTANDQALFESGDAAGLLTGYYDLWAGADLSVINLECPLTDSGTRIKKVGPHLKASPQCIAFFKNSGAKAICLANNHIQDYGGGGVIDTLHACTNAGLPTVGAGRNLDEARIPLFFTANGLRVAVIAMAEREFNIAGPDLPGANPIDYKNLTILKETSEQTDFVLVLIHGGTEMLQFPRPGLVELCRFLVDQGAGAVIVQHTHCVGCHEVYRGSPIIYGQGNGIFSSGQVSLERTDPNWFEGLLVELQIASNKQCAARFYPYAQSRGFIGLRPLETEARNEFLRAFHERSRVLEAPLELRRKWDEHCKLRRRDMVQASFGVLGALSSLDARIPFTMLLHWLTNARLRRNMVSCESHREILQDCLRG